MYNVIISSVYFLCVVLGAGCCMCTTAYIWRSQDNLCGLALSFTHEGTRNGAFAVVIGLDGNCPYPLSHFASTHFFFVCLFKGSNCYHCCYLSRTVAWCLLQVCRPQSPIAPPLAGDGAHVLPWVLFSAEYLMWGAQLLMSEDLFVTQAPAG